MFEGALVMPFFHSWRCYLCFPLLPWSVSPELRLIALFILSIVFSSVLFPFLYFGFSSLFLLKLEILALIMDFLLFLLLVWKNLYKTEIMCSYDHLVQFACKTLWACFDFFNSYRAIPFLFLLQWLLCISFLTINCFCIRFKIIDTGTSLVVQQLRAHLP